jgi:murein L,D-transpeptidase YcbB/YkuD
LGLPQTGVADSATLTEMAVPLADRIRQMRLNLERRRWQNIELGENHVYVNLADGNARLVLNGETAGFFDITNVSDLSGVPTVAVKAVGIDKAAGALLLDPASQIAAVGGTAPNALKLAEGATFAKLVQEAASLGTGADGKFAQPMTVYVTYLTAWATSDGLVHFRRDAFNRDGALAALLFTGQ